MPGGKTFRIAVKKQSADSKYIRSARLNGKSIPVMGLQHSEMVKGGLLELDLSDAY
jgi:putative alpha-1,2-mannosidase